MTYLALEDPTGRRLSVFPFATLKGVKTICNGIIRRRRFS